MLDIWGVSCPKVSFSVKWQVPSTEREWGKVLSRVLESKSEVVENLTLCSFYSFLVTAVLELGGFELN